VAALRRLRELSRPTVAYAGTYLGWGTHEDACASAVRAAETVGGVTWF
jgi:predicted NAD/FAD-binding protein